jgi:ferric-dicitrate binding protein FerR (iron transport regulator)
MNDMELEQLIAAWLDGRLTETESEVLQQRLRESEESRARFLVYAELDVGLRQMAGGELNLPQLPSPDFSNEPTSVPFWSGMNLLKLATAALLLLVVGMQAYQIGKRNADEIVATPEIKEKTISGHAMIRRMADVQWKQDSKVYREGDVVSAGLLQFNKGIAEIDFFCGATVIVDGPAQLEIESDWSLRLIEGRIRANVPPAARGFAVKVADSEVIDLGTEFVLDVSESNAWIKVVDGEVALKGGSHDGQHLKTGEGQSLLGAGVDQDSFDDLSTLSDVQRRHDKEQNQLFEKWKSSVEKLKSDKRIIAYYPIGMLGKERTVKNAASTGSELDGRLVGLVDQGAGRFGPVSTGLGFKRPGSRVRVRLDGTYQKFTFACWVRIDSLDHKYNALFMGDGYENGEPHWQILGDGKLMFSVMVDDTPGSGHGKHPEARLHKIYYSKPIWDVSLSGKWMHLAATYDPERRLVHQYVNGEEVSKETITDEFFVEQLKIGPAEIGNWGQPLRDSPWFAIRNLNGAIDELAIFDAALSGDEVRQIYDNGKPFHDNSNSFRNQ